jgi:hypothetical protein
MCMEAAWDQKGSHRLQKQQNLRLRRRNTYKLPSSKYATRYSERPGISTEGFIDWKFASSADGMIIAGQKNTALSSSGSTKTIFRGGVDNAGFEGGTDIENRLAIAKSP